MSSPQHIVFDIGKVLVHWEPELAYLDVIPDAAERTWFLSNICSPQWNIEQDRGRSWADAEAILIAEFPDHEANIRAFRKNWHKMVPHAYPDSVAVLRRLVADDRDITMLTNFAADTFAEARERFDFLNISRGVTVSGEVGLLKPDRAIYDLHASTFGLDPASTLFIDDTAHNVEGAKQAGWQAVQFTGAGTLKRDLAGFGIKV